MAEIMPASFSRRWTVDAPRRDKRRVLPGRWRLGLILASCAMVLAGASAGLLAWWKPLQRPAVIVVVSAPQGNVDIDRALSMSADGAALTQQLGPHGRVIVDETAPTRSELLHYVNMIRLAKGGEHVFLQVSATAGLSAHGEVMLFTSDVGPTNVEGATPLSELLDAASSCRAAGLLVLLDLVPASAATLSVVPPTDIASLVDNELRHAKLGNAAVVISHSPGERSQLMPAAGRTLFSWVISRGLSGEADGTHNELRDGRISTEELLAYTTQTLPPLALRITAEPQHLRVYGTTHTFDVSLAIASHKQAAEKREYPVWLVNGWQRWADSSNLLDDQSSAAWEQALRRAEFAIMCSDTAVDTKPLQASIDAYHAEAAATAPTTADFQTALDQYLVTRRDTLEQVAAAQAKATEQKLLAAFMKTNAATAPGDVVRAACTLAGSTPHASLAEWQAIKRLLDVWPKLPESDDRELFDSLCVLREAAPTDDVLAEAARLSLLVAIESRQAGHDPHSWPWLHTLLDQMLDGRTHGDTLLFARGYAPIATAQTAISQAYEEARQLRLASESIQTVMKSQSANRRFIVHHLYLAETDPALTEAWSDAVGALEQLDTLLMPPPAPLATTAELRELVRDLNAACSAVDSGLVQLRSRISSSVVAQAVAACRQPEADAHDIYRAGLLLRSNSLAAKDRGELWMAYAALATKLRDASAAVPQGQADSADVLAALHARRVSMHSAWHGYIDSQLKAGATSVTDEDLQLWWRGWQRFRDDELNRVAGAGGPPVWSSAALEVMGPFVCDALSPQQPLTTFDVLWQQHRDDTPTPTVSAVSPDDNLAVQVLNPAPKAHVPVRFQLRLKQASKPKLSGDGFLAIFKSDGRTYHAPIALPGAKNSQAVNILLSPSNSRLQLLDRVPLLGGHAAVFVWLENNTSDPQQVLVTLDSAIASPPLALAPHEVRCATLLPPAAGSPRSELVVGVQEVASQRQLAQRCFAFFSPSAGDVVRCKSARIESSTTRGCVLTIEVETTQPNTDSLAVSLQLSSAKSGRALNVNGGRTRALLTKDSSKQTLSATLDSLPAREKVRCDIFVDGIREPLVLTGLFPASGDTTILHNEQRPQVAISGDVVSQPTANYLLSLVPTGAASDDRVSLSLRSVADGSVVLSRQVEALPPPVATLTATVPPGGLMVNPIATPATQAFDTSGLAGHFLWHADLLAGAATVASSELPVVFDNSPPTSCRFVRPSTLATKESIVPLQVTVWDELTDIATVDLFLGKAIDGKAPPGTRLFRAKKSSGDAALWEAAVTMPKDLGPCEVTAVATNGAGLATTFTTTVTVLDSLPQSHGEIRGVVMEGALPQAGLDVALEQAPGAALKTTKTDANGQFTFAEVTPGNYTVAATKSTSQRKGSTPVKVEANQTTTTSIKLAL